MDFRIERRDSDQEADSSVENHRLQTQVTPPMQPVLMQHPIQDNVTTRTNAATSDHGVGNFELWSSQDDIEMRHPPPQHDDIRDEEVAVDNGQSDPNDKGQDSSDSESPFVNVHIRNLQQHAAHGQQPHTSRASTRVRGSHYDVQCPAGYMPVPYKHAQITSKTKNLKERL